MKFLGYLLACLATHACARATKRTGSVLSADAQDLFDYSMQVQDGRYDSYYNFIQYSDKGSWSVRFTAWYLAGLLHRNQDDDIVHAKAAIRNILACQMTSDFDAAWYGTYKLSPDQPDPTVDSPLYPPEIYTTYDPNWREFIGTQLIQVVEEFSHLLDTQLISDIEDSLEIAAVGGMRRNGTFPEDDNLTLGYSNPGMMRALVVGWIGQRRNNSTFTSFANSQGTQILQLFQRNNANTLSEYNAPTYYGIDTWALGAQIKYGPPNSSMTAAAHYILPALWSDLAAHFNGYLGNMVGPYDRAYTRDITQHSAVLSLLFWGLFGRENTPQPPIAESDFLFDVAQGAAIALVVDTIAPLLPSSIRERITNKSGPETPVLLNSTIYDSLDAEAEPRIATSWMSRDLMIGGIQIDEEENRGDQFVPAIVHWAGDKAHTPYPVNTFFSLYPSASSVHAVASENHLSISYPNRTQEGADIFTFAVSNVPPSWTLGTARRVSGLEDLPCVEVEVEARGLEKQDVGYGESLRNHLFYNVTYVVPEGFEGVPRVELGIRYTC